MTLADWIHGIDVSHHQKPDAIPWAAIAQSSRFCIVRATYGAGADDVCLEHVRRAREAGLTVGLYAFFRETIAVEDQFNAFCAVADAVNLGPDDLLPALDVEDWPKVFPPKSDADWFRISPATSEPAEEWCERATDTYGGAILYTSQRDWGRMGSPAWMLAYPLWCAHYPGHEIDSPATPDHRPCRIWQYNGTHAYQPGAFTLPARGTPPDPHAIDMNWARDPLPLIAHPGQVAPEPEIVHHEPSYITDVDWAEFQAARTAAVTSEDT